MKSVVITHVNRRTFIYINSVPCEVQKNIKNAAVPVYNYFLARLNFDESPSMFKRQVKAYLLSNDVSFLL